MRASRQAFGAAAAAFVVLLARDASAGNATSAQWYVETVGTRCADQRTAFEREITLACNAVGGSCRVATSPKEAELRAVIDCSGLDDSWTLVTRTIDGTVLANLDLSGPHDDRLREAAVEVARDAAPEQALAADTLLFTLTKEEPMRAANQPERLALALGGRISGSTSETSTAGIHILAGLALAKSARATLGVIGDAGGNGDAAMRALRGGAGFAFGAPFDAAAPMGFAAEGGAAATMKYGPPPASGGPLATKTVAAAYCQGTVTVQWPRESLRPYAALSAATLSDGLHIIASGEIGLAFPLF